MPVDQLTPIETEFVDKLENEYKILQDKIDKIGAFRFTIKGWSITVILAAAFASASTAKIPAWLWLVSLFGFLILFFLFELEQTTLRHKFGQRCILIESAITRVLIKNSCYEFRRYDREGAICKATICSWDN